MLRSAEVGSVDVESAEAPALKPTSVLNVVDVADRTVVPLIWYVEKGAMDIVWALMVDDACKPPWNQIAVEVAFAVAPKLEVVVHGNANVW